MLQDPNGTSLEVPQQLRQEDAERSQANKARYGSMYDPWDDESPAATSHGISAEIRKLLQQGRYDA